MWVCFGPAYRCRLMLEFLDAHGRVGALVSPALILLVLPADHWWRCGGWWCEYYPRKEGSAMSGNWQKHMWWKGLEVCPVVCWDTVLSQVRMLRHMQAICGARFWVMHVADDLLRLGAWGLSVSIKEARLPQFSCGCSARVWGDITRSRVN